MALAFIPKIVYNSITINLTWPQKLWSPKSKSVGGVAWSDSGVPEAFVLRRDQMVSLELRFTEAEWQSIDAWLTWAQSGQPFTFYFDKNLGANATYYLIEPAMGDGEVKPTRDPSNRSVFSIPIVMRTTNNAIISISVG